MNSHELWSCFCLFDDCCRSKYEREAYSLLVERIEKNFDRSFWIVRITEQFKKEQRYVCCLDHCTRIMEKLVISPAQHETLTTSCHLIDPEDPINPETRNTDCFQYYQADKVELNDFCLGCKSYFLTVESFQLKKKFFSMESSANQLVPYVDTLKLSSSSDQVVPAPDSPLLIEIEENLCKRLQEKFVGKNCYTYFIIVPGLIRFFIRFNNFPMRPIADLLRELNSALGKNMQDEGWDFFFIRENKIDTSPTEGLREWECISHNLNFLDILKHIR